MKQTFQLPITFFLTFFFFSCSYQKPGSNEYFVREEGKTIRKRTTAFTRAHITRDTAFLNNIFTKDARVLAPNSEVVTGKKSISQLNSEWVNYGVHQFEEISTAMYGGGNFIVDEGNYFMIYGPDSTSERGKYINVWKKVNGNWKIYSNIWNSSLPLPDPVYERMLTFAKNYTDAWNSHVGSNMASFYAEYGSLTVNNGTPSVGRKELAATAKSYMDAFPDLKLTMDSLVMEGEIFKYYWTFEGTNTGPGGTGNSVLFSGYEQWTMNDEGLIQVSIGSYDADDYQKQLAGKK
jgi:ketosteroid isomerase-like protein